MSSILVIYNPVAGRGRVKKHWQEVQQGLIDAGIEFDVTATSAPLEAVTLAEKAATKYSTVIAVGGDGTVHEVVNGLLRASSEGETIALGIVPLGNGDDFAKMIPPQTTIGGKVFDWQVAIEKITQGQTKLFDVGRMSGNQLPSKQDNKPQYFMNGINAKKYSHRGTVTPDHVIRIKPYPMIVNMSATDTVDTFRKRLEIALNKYKLEYVSYFKKYSKGKKLIGWDEILEGGLAKDATVHLTCWMTISQIKNAVKDETGKVLFSEFQ